MKVRSGFGYARSVSLDPETEVRHLGLDSRRRALRITLVRRLDRVSKRVRRHPSLTMFVLLGFVPVGLAAPSFRQPVVLPASVIGRVEVTFRLLVYVPVAGIGAIPLEPLDIGGVLGIPVFEQSSCSPCCSGFAPFSVARSFGSG